MVSNSLILNLVLVFSALLSIEARQSHRSDDWVPDAEVKYLEEVYDFLREIHELDRMIDGDLKKPIIEIEPPEQITTFEPPVTPYTGDGGLWTGPTTQLPGTTSVGTDLL